MLASIYAFLIVIVYDFFKITIGDPADDLLLGVEKDYDKKFGEKKAKKEQE